jgi:hypothetical protein
VLGKRTSNVDVVPEPPCLNFAAVQNGIRKRSEFGYPTRQGRLFYTYAYAYHLSPGMQHGPESRSCVRFKDDWGPGNVANESNSCSVGTLSSLVMGLGGPKDQREAAALRRSSHATILFALVSGRDPHLRMSQRVFYEIDLWALRCRTINVGKVWTLGSESRYTGA